MQTLQRNTRSPRAFAMVLLLVLALLLAQALGLAHRVLHHPYAAGQGGAGVTTQVKPGAAAPAVAGAHVAGLFQHGDQDPTCRIFDQAGGADSLACVPAVALPMAITSYILLYFQGEVLARWVALFDARGPPPVR